jgi:hypothetical protein
MKTNIITLFYLILLSLLAINCTDSGFVVSPLPPSDNHEKVTIPQGVWGNVTFWEGDFMPSTDKNPRGRIYPVVRDVFIYEATRMDSAVRPKTDPYGGFFEYLLTRQIASTRSDESGFYEVSLLPGKYSIFIKEGDYYYATGFDSQQHLNPFFVASDSVTEVPLNILTHATF